VALSSLARAPADGRTLAFCAISPLTLSPHFGLRAPAVRAISGVMRTPQLVVATPTLGDIGWTGMLARARAEDGRLRWATSGVGTLGHLILEQVCEKTRINVIHVPYSGGGTQILDAVAGRVELLSTNLAPAQLELLAARRLFALALGAPSRAPLLPEVPTLAELGCPEASRASLFGVFAAPQTPHALAEDINRAMARAMASATFQTLLTASGNSPWSGSAAMFSQEIDDEAHAIRAMLAPARRPTFMPPVT
jgi:tripartite-type tricarboxylate transporter receptor subunit TctC